MRSKHRIIELPERSDQRGSLTFAQQGDHIPFIVKRFFAIYGVTEGANRGAHAHRNQHQLLIMVAGAATVIVDDGLARTAINLNRPNLAIYAPPLLWVELTDFSAQAVCMVLTSDIFSEADYIRDRAEFLQLAGTN